MKKPNFKLEIFEGPLDLLLHLIQKHELNIYDIEISKLLEQYLEYIEMYRQLDMEIAGEFLEMAARLIYIKTVSLLPKPEIAEKEKQELQGDLIEYSICKQMAQLLSGKFEGFDIFVRKPMEFKFSKRYTRHHDPLELSTVYCQLNQRPQEEKMRLLAEQRVKNVVSEKPVSVMSKVIYLLRQLFNNKVVYIDQLYDGLKDKSSRIAMFLAILELTRNGRIVISDDNTEIYLKQERKRKKSTESEVK
jgi:segregation and condensation protein A